MKFQVFGSICFPGKSNFEDNDTQNYLLFQLVISKYFLKKIDISKKSSNRNYISGWKSKGSNNGSTKPPAVSNHSLAPELDCINTK